MNPEAQHPAGRGEIEAGRHVKCDDIQVLLFDYMSRELGDSRSALVREHLRHCPDCRAAAAEIQSTLDALHGHTRASVEIPEALSSEHRERIAWALAHPVLDWVYRHHVIVSIVVALAAIAVLSEVLYQARAPGDDRPAAGPTVVIGQPPATTNHHPARGHRP